MLKDVPCGQPPEIAWADVADQPTVIEREDRDQKPESKLDPRYPRKVFVSYSHEPESKALVTELTPILQRCGWEVVVEQLGLKPGEQIPEFCYRVRECAFLIPVIAESYLRKRWCLDELFSFFEERGCDLDRFRDHTLPAAGTGQLDTPSHIAVHQRYCLDNFPLLSGDADLDDESRRQYRRLGRWSNEVSNLLVQFVKELGTFGFAALRANEFAAIVDGLERKYTAADRRAATTA